MNKGKSRGLCGALGPGEVWLISSLDIMLRFGVRVCGGSWSEDAEVQVTVWN